MKAEEIKEIIEKIKANTNKMPVMDINSFIDILDMGNFDDFDENITYLALERSGAYKLIGIEKECEIAAQTSADNVEYINKIFAIASR